MSSPDPKTEKHKAAFIHRGVEQHYTVNFSAQDPQNFSREAEILRRASQIGLNRVYMGERWPDLGVNLVDYAESFPELATKEGLARTAERRGTFLLICEEALRLGIEPWISYNVINYPDCFTTKFPDAIAEQPPAADRWLRTPPARGLSKQPQLCPSSASFKRLVIAQVTELCTLPHVSGIECFLTGADTDLFFCNCPVCKRKSMADLIREFAGMAYPVCKDHGKRLALRCYLGGWRCALETEVWREAAPSIPEEIEITYKQQQGDLMNWHGPNPVAGMMAPHHENVEFDVGGEYRGVNYGMVCSVRWQMSELIRYYRDCGVKGILCRGLDSQHPFDLDKWLFGALAQNPDLDVTAWCMDWASKRYGAAGGKVLSLLDDCAEVIRQSMYVRGVQWASWAVPQNLSRLRFILFDRSAPCTPGAYERLQPTPENRKAIAEEKKIALQKADEIVARCEALGTELDDRFMVPLKNSVLYLRAYVALSGPLMEAFFAFLAWTQSHSEVTREYHRFFIVSAIDKAEQSVQQGREQVRQIDLMQLERMSEVAGFVQSASLEKKFDEPFHNALVILDEIRENVNTTPASWWSVYPWPERWPAALRDLEELYRGSQT